MMCLLANLDLPLFSNTVTKILKSTLMPVMAKSTQTQLK